MVRRTVTLNDFLYGLLQKARGIVITKTGEDVPFTYILNVVILLGLCNPLPTEELLKIIKSFDSENYKILKLADLEDRLLELFTSYKLKKRVSTVD